MHYESQFQSLEGFHEDMIEANNSRKDAIPFLSALDKDLEEQEQLSGSLSCLLEFGQHLLETYHQYESNGSTSFSEDDMYSPST